MHCCKSRCIRHRGAFFRFPFIASSTTYADHSSVSMKIRVNLYVTTLLNAMIPNFPLFDPLRDVLTTNAGVSGTALLITAVIQTAQHQLSLYHAIFILHMLFFLGITVSPTGYRLPPGFRSGHLIAMLFCRRIIQRKHLGSNYPFHYPFLCDHASLPWMGAVCLEHSEQI
jgi:hypothetical protein